MPAPLYQGVAIRIIQIINDQNFYIQHFQINSLIEKIKNTNNLLFSACYVAPSKGKQKKFYEIMSFIDIDEKKLFVFDYMEDPF